MTNKTIILENETVPYQLSKSRRKTAALQISRDGMLLVKVPVWMTLREIEKMLLQKAQWITANRHRVLETLALQEQRQFTTGERLYFRGKEYPLEIRESRAAGIKVTMSEEAIILLGPTAEPDSRRASIEKWYREQARVVLTAKTEYYAKLLEVSFRDIRIKSQKSRWGSCSAKGNINYNWHIIKAPDRVADYLVVHELCHLLHMNHSPAFWQAVARILPEYQELRQWLKTNGDLLRT